MNIVIHKIKRGGNYISELNNRETNNEEAVSTDYAVNYKELASTWKELSNFSGTFAGLGNQGSANIREDDLLKYLQNPQAHLKQIRNASVYLSNKHGVLKDVNRMIKTLPTLKYSLNWNVDDSKKIKEHEKTVNKFLQDIDVVKFIRDGLYEVAVLGTVVPLLISKKYIHFLELDETHINTKRNGKWVVHYDLKYIDSYKTTSEKLNKLQQLPNEVSLAGYNAYKKNKSDEFRYIELKNCEVVSNDSFRNNPHGLPYTIGAWVPLLHKERIDKVEDSMSDRLLTQILTLKAGHFDKEGKQPVTDDVVAPYFQGISQMLKTKENTARKQNSGANGSGLIQLPFFLELDSLDIDATLFEKDLYDKVENDIFMNLSVSKALIYGEGGNYSSAQVNSEKFFNNIFSLVEQFESVVNSFIKTVLPKDIGCNIKFNKSTVLDKQTEISNKHELYMQTGVISPYLEAVMDMPVKDIIELKKHEKELGLNKLFKPAENAHTSSNKGGGVNGRPKEDDSGNDNTNKSKSSGGNNNPSPSDE